MTRWLSAPLWPLQIFTGHKAFTNPLLASERLNRRNLYVARVKGAAALAARRRRRLKNLVSADERAELEANGAIVTRLVAGEDLEALREEVLALNAQGYEMREGDAITRRIPLTPEALAQAPRLEALVRSKAFQGRVRYVGSFDMAPDIFVQTIFTLVDGMKAGAPDPQNTLHMDTFHSTVKAWLWLDDVDAETGPFTYVFGSHRLDERRLAWQKRRSILAATGKGSRGGSMRALEADCQAMRLTDPHEFVVPGGTFVVGDTMGFHRRGRARRPSQRVEIWASLRPNPFFPFVRVPLWPPAALSDRAFAWWLKGASWAVKKGLRERADWHDVGAVSPGDPPRHPSLSGGAQTS